MTICYCREAIRQRKGKYQEDTNFKKGPLERRYGNGWVKNERGGGCKGGVAG